MVRYRPYTRETLEFERIFSEMTIFYRAGIGIHDDGEGFFLIESIDSGSSAEKCGQIKTGDILCKVEGMYTFGRKLEEINALLIGPALTKVNIAVETPFSVSPSLTKITLFRDVILRSGGQGEVIPSPQQSNGRNDAVFATPMQGRKIVTFSSPVQHQQQQQVILADQNFPSNNNHINNVIAAASRIPFLGNVPVVVADSSAAVSIPIQSLINPLPAREYEGGGQDQTNFIRQEMSSNIVSSAAPHIFSASASLPTPASGIRQVLIQPASNSLPKRHYLTENGNNNNNVVAFRNQNIVQYQNPQIVMGRSFEDNNNNNNNNREMNTNALPTVIPLTDEVAEMIAAANGQERYEQPRERKLARAIEKGLRASDVIVKLYRVPETLSASALEKLHAAKEYEVPIISPEELTQADGIIFGVPARFGMMCSQMKAFFDSTFPLLKRGDLMGKPASLFFSTGTQHGGQESTALSIIPFLASHGMIYVPLGFLNKGMHSIDEPHGGSPYGSGTIAAPDGSRDPSTQELALAVKQGALFAEITKRLSRPR